MNDQQSSGFLRGYHFSKALAVVLALATSFAARGDCVNEVEFVVNEPVIRELNRLELQFRRERGEYYPKATEEVIYFLLVGLAEHRSLIGPGEVPMPLVDTADARKPTIVFPLSSLECIVLQDYSGHQDKSGSFVRRSGKYMRHDCMQWHTIARGEVHYAPHSAGNDETDWGASDALLLRMERELARLAFQGRQESVGGNDVPASTEISFYLLAGLAQHFSPTSLKGDSLPCTSMNYVAPASIFMISESACIFVGDVFRRDTDKRCKCNRLAEYFRRKEGDWSRVAAGAISLDVNDQSFQRWCVQDLHLCD